QEPRWPNLVHSRRRSASMAQIDKQEALGIPSAHTDASVANAAELSTQKVNQEPPILTPALGAPPVPARSSSNRLSSNRETNGFTNPPAATGGIQGIAPPSVALTDRQPIYCFRCPLNAPTPAIRTIDSGGGSVGLCESCFAAFARAEVTPKGWVLPAERSLPERPLPCSVCREKAVRRADSDGLPLGLCGACFSVFAEQVQVPKIPIEAQMNREGNTLPSIAKDQTTA